MNKPTDEKLYNKIKKDLFKKYPKNSAYRSGLLVKKYKAEYEKKYNKKDYYKKETKTKKGLKIWFASKWRNQRGEVGYKKVGDVYRPTVKVSKDTPKTYKELGGMKSKRIKKAMKEKKKTGRVKKF